MMDKFDQILSAKKKKPSKEIVIWNYDLGKYEDVLKDIIEVVPQFFGVIDKNSNLLNHTIDSRNTFKFNYFLQLVFILFISHSDTLYELGTFFNYINLLN